MLENIRNNVLNLVAVKHHLEECTKRFRSLSHQIFNFVSQLHLESSLDLVRFKIVAHQIYDVVLVISFFKGNFELIKIRAVREVLVLPFDNE